MKLSFSHVSMVLVEALVVGLVLAASLSVSDILVPITNPKTAALTGLVVGALVHIGFEVFGANAWYCTEGASCRKKSAF